MTKKVLLTTALTALTFITLTSNKTGPASNGNGNKTGGPGSGGQTCAMPGCHTSGIGTTTGAFEVRKRFKPDSNGIVNSYLPDSLYTVKLSGTHPTLTKYGFQLEVLKLSDSADAGTISNLGPKVQSKTVGGRTILEHTDTISATTMSITFVWKAPAKNSGQVRFYGIVNATNGDGTNANDKPSSTIIQGLAESLNTPYLANETRLIIYPNPVAGMLNINRASIGNGIYQLQVINNNGQVVSTTATTVNNGTLDYNLNTSALSAGLYMLQVLYNGQQQVVPFIKQ
eukprot:TRINITY_DN94132_c0_g1_i1.p1 TRINITY_DN94132_c0_g1~~TRINITY_DN94132_c0_g1_i1.p1  ORF type:complete len:285 (-),score=22.18 TRINITY_DN94132_c0_g1_i1:324-1178(-)